MYMRRFQLREASPRQRSIAVRRALSPTVFARALIARRNAKSLLGKLPYSHRIALARLITTMSLALQRACDALRLNVIDDAATRLVAENHQSSAAGNKRSGYSSVDDSGRFSILTCRLDKS
jgi:hypothetical protein